MDPQRRSRGGVSEGVGGPERAGAATRLVRWVRIVAGLDRPDYEYQLLGLTLVVTLIPTMALMLMHGILLACVGRWLARRRKYKTTFVISIFNLTNLPMGTALSAITLVILLRPAARQLYNPNPTPSAPEPTR